MYSTTHKKKICTFKQHSISLTDNNIVLYQKLQASILPVASSFIGLRLTKE